jgi:hypothetical protein
LLFKTIETVDKDTPLCRAISLILIFISPISCSNKIY